MTRMGLTPLSKATLSKKIRSLTVSLLFVAGDLGSKLPAMPAQAIWKAGSFYEVGWTVSAHHGGGYAYRLAPADGPLTEVPCCNR